MASSKRSNRSPKKAKSSTYKQTLKFESHLMKSFVGKQDTLPNMIKGYKVKVSLAFSDDQQYVFFHIMGKHRNQIAIVSDKFIDRYNNIVRITNNVITSLKES